jgi:hypothetical protein
MKLKAGRFAIVVGLAMLFGVPSVGSAQTGCGYYTFCFDGNWHSNPDGAVWGYVNTHMECAYCLGGPSGCHYPCPFGFGTPTERKAYLAATEAAARFDVGALLDLAPSTGARVIFNPSRNSLQILSCDKSRTIASLQVGWLSVSRPGELSRLATDQHNPQRIQSLVASWGSSSERLSKSQVLAR